MFSPIPNAKAPGKRHPAPNHADSAVKAPVALAWVLTLAALVVCGPAASETPGPMSTLNATHAEQRFGLILEQQGYWRRARIGNLPPGTQRREQQHLHRERIQLERLQQRQDSERGALQHRLQVLPPGTAPAAAVPLQNQRFRQEQRSQELHFKLFRLPHP